MSKVYRKLLKKLVEEEFTKIGQQAGCRAGLNLYGRDIKDRF